MNTNKKSMTVVLTCLGLGAAYGIIKSLRLKWGAELRIVATDGSPSVCYREMADEFVLAPPIDDTSYVPFILELCRRVDAKALWPLHTRELARFARVRDGFYRESGCTIITSQECAIELANDKGRLFGWMEKTLPELVLPYRIIRSYAELCTAALYFGYPEKRVCLKPVHGAGYRGFKILDAKADLLHLLVHSLPGYPQTTLEAMRFMERVEEERFSPFLVTPYLEGGEYDVEVLSYKGEIYYAVPRVNADMLLSTSLVSEVIQDQRLESLAGEIIQSLNLDYVNSVTFRADGQGRLYLLELNPRPPATIIAATLAGINLPAGALDLAVHQKLHPQDTLSLPAITVRYWEERVRRK